MARLPLSGDANDGVHATPIVVVAVTDCHHHIGGSIGGGLGSGIGGGIGSCIGCVGSSGGSDSGGGEGNEGVAG